MNIYVLETAKQLSALGCIVDVYTRRHDPKDEQVTDLAPGARVIHLSAGPATPAKEGVYELLPEFCQRLADIVSDENLSYDLVVSHYWLSGLVGERLRKAWKVPHATSFHTLAETKRRARPGERDAPQRALSERKVAQNADIIVAWSAHERDAIASYYGAAPEKVAIIPPGVDTTTFRPLDRAACRNRLGLGDEDVLLYVGRLERLKGVDILLRATAQLETRTDIKLLIVGGSGNSPETERLKALATELRLGDKVQFVGSVPHTDLPTYYNAADVCVLPSHYESFGLAALEASACGRPVVASRVGGLPSVVLDGQTGYLVAWRCPGAFLSRLELLLANARLRRQMGNAARAHAETLTWERSSSRLLVAFNSLVRSGPRASDIPWSPVAEVPCVTIAD